ncbi:hypothetical protein DENSPDRAFT_899721 [Dentipellis sp. KUC8613]|nr:hypothetical protein DENSPDRAFT_899721 [Dentipellis sp. KUC8613]
MHLVALNLTDLFLSLWRGTMECDSSDDIETWDFAVFRNVELWKWHGAYVGGTRPYLPGIFDCPPRDVADKLTSGYKSQEFLTYFCGLAPALLYGILPEKYWCHFCKLISSLRILHQHKITSEEIIETTINLNSSVKEFEELYYCRRKDRLHFCRPCMHAVIHVPPESRRIGPHPLLTQYTLEHTIGNLGEEIKQPSQPYANLSQRGVRRAQVNALKVAVPELDSTSELQRNPSLAVALDGGYELRHARDKRPYTMTLAESQAFWSYLQQHDNKVIQIYRWARLALPNGHIARSFWSERNKSIDKLRISRNVKIQLDKHMGYAEVQFYFRVTINGVTQNLALVSLYSEPDQNLLQASFKTVWACHYQGQNALKVIKINAIKAVVGMVPFPVGSYTQEQNIQQRPCFVVEKIGLERDTEMQRENGDAN